MPGKLLMIGGGIFVGRAIVRHALERGWQITALSRGQSKPGLPEGVRSIRGDRMDEQLLNQLAEEKWDLVVDTCAYLPHQVELLLKVVGPACARLLFISTVSVYDMPPANPFVEDSPLLPACHDRDFHYENYGKLKVACEGVLLDGFAEKSIILRPGLIVGSEDPTDRFLWWARQMLKGMSVPAPFVPEQPVQWTDVEAFAAFGLDLAERAASGIWNVTGPEKRMALVELLNQLADAFHPAGRDGIQWTAPGKLLKAGILPWQEMPLWLPDDQSALDKVDSRKAFADGWKPRPLSDQIAQLKREEKIWTSLKRTRDLDDLLAEKPLG
jgi:2'-hydroxyisoflavone reductase